MQDQAIAKCELPGIQHQPVSVLNDRITSHTPFFVLKNACAVLARRLSVGLISVIPIGGRIREHKYLHRNINSREVWLSGIDLFVGWL